MAASFPGSTKAFTDKVDLIDVVQASHINDLQNEVAAIEAEALDQSGIILTTTKVNAADAKTTPSDSDVFPLLDSSASYGLKKSSWANVKAALKTYFDMFYAATAHAHAAYAAVVHAHAASDITSGTMATDRLGSGTANSGTYLRGDQTWAAVAGGRDKLTANRTYYVATTGLDSNTGLTAGTPFLTIQRAIDVCAAGLDLAGYTVTIQLADGTYAAGASVKNMVGMASPASLTIQGNATTPSNVYVNAGGGYGFYLDSSQAFLKNLKVSGSVGISATFSTLYLSNVEFGACSAYHMNIQACKILFQGSAGYKISGNAALHMFITGNSFVLCEGIGPVSAVGTITFSSGFVLVDGGSVLRINGNTYPGTWIGTRYILASNGVIFTNGAAETYLPGSVLGVKSSGGEYV